MGIAKAAMDAACKRINFESMFLGAVHYALAETVLLGNVRAECAETVDESQLDQAAALAVKHVAQATRTLGPDDSRIRRLHLALDANGPSEVLKVLGRTENDANSALRRMLRI